MARHTVLMPDALMARLREHPAARGNLSAFVRHLILDALASAAPVGGEPPARGRPIVIRARLRTKDAACLKDEAAAFGLSRAAWLAAMVERRFRNSPRFSRAGEVALISIQMELRRIGQAMVALASRTADVSEETGSERWPGVDAETLSSVRAEVRGYMAAIRGAFEGNLDYWVVEHE